MNVTLDFDWEGQHVNDHFVWDCDHQDLAHIRCFALGLLVDSLGPKLASVSTSALDGYSSEGRVEFVLRVADEIFKQIRTAEWLEQSRWGGLPDCGNGKARTSP